MKEYTRMKFGFIAGHEKSIVRESEHRGKIRKAEKKKKNEIYRMEHCQRP